MYRLIFHKTLLANTYKTRIFFEKFNAYLKEVYFYVYFIHTPILSFLAPSKLLTVKCLTSHLKIYRYLKFVRNNAVINTPPNNLCFVIVKEKKLKDMFYFPTNFKRWRWNYFIAAKASDIIE